MLVCIRHQIYRPESFSTVFAGEDQLYANLVRCVASCYREQVCDAYEVDSFSVELSMLLKLVLRLNSCGARRCCRNPRPGI